MLRRPPGDPAVLRQTGSMGETAFYPFLSGRDNLRAVARRCGLGDHRVDVMLGQAGLAAGLAESTLARRRVARPAGRPGGVSLTPGPGQARHR